MFGVERDSQEAPLISLPRRCQHHLGDVQEGLLQLGSVGKVNPHQPQLLCNEEAMRAIVGVHHGQWVPQAVGHFLQTQLQTALRVCLDSTQVLGQPVIAEQVRVAVIGIVQLQKPAETVLVAFGLVYACVVGQEGDDGATLVPELRAVIRAEAWDGP